MHSLTFTYFQGPADDMAYLSEGDHKCDFCNCTVRCFSLDETDVPKDGAQYGCADCLRKGRFHFWHDTEVGLLTEKSPLPRHVYKHNKSVPEGFNQAAFATLLRTPQIVTWQQEVWLTHCNDFMAYLGTWKPVDFHLQAKDNDGRKLFLEMTDADLAHLWNEATPTGDDGPKDWYAAYYAFRCLHCGALRGNWDCP